jgi:leader peptidase (prepilin peptidase)/N-methyltransferase
LSAVSFEWIPPAVTLIAAGAFGLVFGSFANVVIYRAPRKRELAGTIGMPASSYCPGCRHPIRFYDNVPVISFLLLRGRCRDCGTRIPWRYPLVELASGTLFVACMATYGPTVRFAIAAWFAWILLVLAVIDGMGIPGSEYDAPAGEPKPARVVHVLPDKLVLPSLVAALAFAVIGVAGSWVLKTAAWLPLVPAAPPPGLLGHPLVASLGGMLVGAGLLLALSLIWHGGMGGGDIKLTAFMGVVLGWYVLLAVFLGATLGAVVGIAQIARGKRKRKDTIPFGPFLAMGGVVALLWGPVLLGAYARAVGL